MEHLKMLPEDLGEDELEHELKIRHLNHLVSRRDRTAGLRNALKCESDNSDVAPIFRDDILDSGTEFRVCELKMETVNNALDVAHKANDYAAFLVVVSRVKHLIGRLSRLEEAFPNNSQFAEAKDAVSKTLDNIVRIDFSKLRNSRSVRVPTLPKVVVNEVVDFNIQGAAGGYELPSKRNTGEVRRANSDRQRVSSEVNYEASSKSETEKYQILEKKVDLLTESLSKLLSHPNFAENLQPRQSTVSVDNPLRQNSRSQVSNSRNATVSVDNPPRQTNQSHGSRVRPVDNTLRQNNQSHVSYNQFSTNLDGPVQHEDTYVQGHGHVNREALFQPVRREEAEQNPRRVFDRANRFNRKSIPVNQWNVKFSGDESGLSLSEFLGEVELFAKSERLSREDLFDSAVHLFAGPARKWFKAQYLDFNSWDELVEDLKFEFQPEYYDYMLLSEIDSRFQGKDETFCSFLAEMQILFGKLGCPLGENHKLYILRKNMHSSYAVAMATIEINTVRQLAIICKRIDSSKLMQVKQGMTNATQTRFLEPAFRTPVSFKKYQSINVMEDECESRDNMIDAMKFNVQDRVQNRILKCFKCEATGHMHRDCKLPQTYYFCYTCGLKNVTVSNCPNCNKYKNLNE